MFGFRSARQRLADDVQPAADARHLHVLRVLLQGAGTKDHGEPEAAESTWCPGCLQSHPDDIQRMDIL